MMYQERYSDSVITTTIYHEGRYALYQVDVNKKVVWSKFVNLQWEDYRLKRCFYAAQQQEIQARKKVLGL